MQLCSQQPSAAGRISFGLIAVLLVLLVAVVGVFSWFGVQNGAVARDEAVKRAWGNVESQYQRRLDLIPNLVETVKGAAGFEQDVLTAVTEARASVGQIRASGDQLLDDPKAFEDFAARQQTLGSALSRLLVVAERYPELTATRNYADLQNQLEGTENRIQVARRDFNAAVEDFNRFVRKLPNKWMLDAAEYPLRQTFQAAAGAEAAPKVDFSRGG